MVVKTVFEFRDYKAYLRSVEEHRPQRGRGFRALLARTTGCQTAYVSQVLNSSAHFGLEQAHAINKLLLHTKDEARFFLLLVEYTRAGTSDLRAHFLEMMEELIQKQLNLTERFKIKEVLSNEDQTEYFSDWAYAAIHLGVTVPRLQTAEDLSDFFQMPLLKVQKVLKFLTHTGLVSLAPSGRFIAGNARLHIGSDSPLLNKHHANWRLQSLSSLERATDLDMHFTSVVSVSEEDVLQIKSRLVKEIEAYNAIIKPSREETIYCFTLDFFTMNRKINNK